MKKSSQNQGNNFSYPDLKINKKITILIHYIYPDLGYC
jgi:hypothetical protein